MKQPTFIASALLIVIAVVVQSQEESPLETEDAVRQRCHSLVEAIRGSSISDEQLDKAYLDPFWVLMDDETRTRLKRKEVVFVVAVGQWIDQQANRGVSIESMRQRNESLKDE